jgi:hypothetical protein
VFLVDREFGCSSAHTLPELGDGQSFHVALAREDSVYFLGGHSTSSDARPPRLVRLRVELLQGAPALSCETLDTGWSSTSAVVLRPGPAHRYIILGGYGADSQKRMECSAAVLDDDGIRFEAVDAPAWTADIAHSRTWFGGAAGGGSALIGVPSEGKATQQDAHRFYEVGFRSEEEGEEEETGGGALGLAAAVVAWGGARGDWGPGGCGSEAVGRATVCVVVVVVVAVAVGRGGAETTVGSTLWTGVDMAMGCFFSWGRGMRL